MEKASALADRGELEAGREVLRAQCALVMESASAEEALSSQVRSTSPRTQSQTQTQTLALTLDLTLALTLALTLTLTLNPTSTLTQLVSEIKDLEQNFRSASQYRAVGSKMSRMQARSHYIQRSNHMSTASYAAGSSRKKAMKGNWGLSSLSSPMADHSDSD